MGHSSIQVTVDTYGHLVPSANVSFVDRLDAKPKPNDESTLQPDATPAQTGAKSHTEISPKVVDLIDGGGWTRTNDLRIMSSPQERHTM